MTDLASELHSATTHLLAKAGPVIEHWGYPGLLLTSFGESTGVPLPGQTLLVAAAVLSTKGDFHIGLVLSLTFIGAVAGSCLGYAIGRVGGRALLLRCRIPAGKLARAESFFARRGVIVVVLARFIDGLRQTAPLVAGSMEMPWWRFFLASTVGAAAWVGVWGLGVYSLVEHSDRLVVALHRVSATGWCITGLTAISTLGWLFWRRQGR